MKKKRRRPIDLPAGHGRREALREVQDELEREGEETTKDVTRFAADKLEPDNEILQYDLHTISNAQPDFQYLWVRYRSESGVSAVDRKRAITIRMAEGIVTPWETVLDGPEALELKRDDGTRRIGDCLLMRCRLDYYEILERGRHQAIREQMFGTDSDLIEAAERRGVPVHSNTHTSNPDTYRRIMARAGGQQLAMRAVDQNIRRGTMPGVTIGR